jgi:uncharacterized surface protein with fasciclin (FAS1) repeats
MKFAKVRVALALVLGVGLLASAVKADDRTEGKTIVEIAVANKDFSTLVAAVKAAGLVETLSGEGPFTVFAPTNEAFEKLGKETIEAVLKDKEKLTKILMAHVVMGKVTSKEVTELDGKNAKTAGGSEFPVKLDGRRITIGKATVIKANIGAKNGVIHVIDTVLLPQ